MTSLNQDDIATLLAADEQTHKLLQAILEILRYLVEDEPEGESLVDILDRLDKRTEQIVDDTAHIRAIITPPE